MDMDMDARSIEQTYNASWRDAGLVKLMQRFDWALRRSEGDIDTAMAAVNEVLEKPITYAELSARLGRPA
jgi:hypothetical protein